MDNLTKLKIDRKVTAAVEEARRDLHVYELHMEVMKLLDKMDKYLDTPENIQLWMRLSGEAHDKYDEAEREAEYVGARLRSKLLSEEGIDFWTGQYLQ